MSLLCALNKNHHVLEQVAGLILGWYGAQNIINFMKIKRSIYLFICLSFYLRKHFVFDIIVVAIAGVKMVNSHSWLGNFIQLSNDSLCCHIKELTGLEKSNCMSIFRKAWIHALIFTIIGKLNNRKTLVEILASPLGFYIILVYSFTQEECFIVDLNGTRHFRNRLERLYKTFLEEVSNTGA